MSHPSKVTFKNGLVPFPESHPFYIMHIEIQNLYNHASDLYFKKGSENGLDIYKLAIHLNAELKSCSIKIKNLIANGLEDFNPVAFELSQLIKNFSQHIKENATIIDRHQGIRGGIQTILNALIDFINLFKTNKLRFFTFEKTAARKIIENMYNDTTISDTVIGKVVRNVRPENLNETAWEPKI